jgi:preprotein translocase subunit SecD
LKLFAEEERIANYTLEIGHENDGRFPPEKFSTPTVTVISQRLKEAGFDFSNSLQEQNNVYQLLFDVRINQAKDTQTLETIFKSKGYLQFWETYGYTEVPNFFPALNQAVDSLYTKEETKKQVKTNDSSLVALMQQAAPIVSNNTLERLIKSPLNHPDYLQILIKDTSEFGKIIRHPAVLKTLPADAVYRYGFSYLDNGDSLLDLHILKTRHRKEPFLDNSSVKLAMPDFDPSSGKPTVLLEFTNKGALAWEGLTERNVLKKIALCMDELVLSAPQVSEKITGGRAQITSSFTVEETKSLAAMMNTLPLPATTTIKNSTLRSVQSGLSGSKWATLVAVFGVTFGLGLFCFNILKSSPAKS